MGYRAAAFFAAGFFFIAFFFTAVRFAAFFTELFLAFGFTAFFLGASSPCARFDHQPELLFRLRGVNEMDLITNVSKTLPLKTHAAAGNIMDTDELGDIFGLDMAQGDDDPNQQRQPESHLHPFPIAEVKTIHFTGNIAEQVLLLDVGKGEDDLLHLLWLRSQHPLHRSEILACHPAHEECAADPKTN